MLLTMARNLMQGAVMGVDNATYHGKEPDTGSCDGGRQCYLPWQGT